MLKVLLGPYGDTGGGEPRVSIAGDDAPVGRLSTSAVALFANELATNALKYGALSAPRGAVHVRTARVGDDLEMVWEERGQPGSAGAPLSAGFGATLLEKAIGRQLGGRLSREWTDAGLVVRIQLRPDWLAR